MPLCRWHRGPFAKYIVYMYCTQLACIYLHFFLLFTRWTSHCSNGFPLSACKQLVVPMKRCLGTLNEMTEDNLTFENIKDPLREIRVADSNPSGRPWSSIFRDWCWLGLKMYNFLSLEFTLL